MAPPLLSRPTAYTALTRLTFLSTGDPRARFGRPRRATRQRVAAFPAGRAAQRSLLTCKKRCPPSFAEAAKLLLLRSPAHPLLLATATSPSTEKPLSKSKRGRPTQQFHLCPCPLLFSSYLYAITYAHLRYLASLITTIYPMLAIHFFCRRRRDHSSEVGVVGTHTKAQAILHRL